MLVDIRTSYDRVAEDYAGQFYRELERKPFDRKMLDWLIERVDGAGPICDMGCGPGQIARYLRDRGAEACGIDLSAGMVACARRLNPDIPFRQGDMLALADVADHEFGGIAAFYSIIHIPRADVVRALGELKRVLRPAGYLLLTFHIGKEILHMDEWYGEEISLDFTFYETAEMREYLSRAGFDIEEAMERDPYPGVEYQSRRGYIMGRAARRSTT